MVTQVKQEYVTSLAEKFKVMSGVVVTNYQGMKCSEMEELRKGMKKINSQYVVVKNTAASIALKQANIGNGEESLTGPTGILIINGDVVQAAKKLVDFTKEHEKLEIKSAHLFGKNVTLAQFKEIANLPAKEVLVGKLLNVLQSPISNLLGVLHAPLRNLVGVVDGIAQKGQK